MTAGTRVAEADSTQERILSAAIQCFAEKGFAGATTRTLAGEAGVNVATLAYHFGGKEGLYAASIDRLYERLLAIQPTAELLAPGTPAERLERAVRFAWRFAREHRTEVRLLMRHVLEHGVLPDQVREGWTQRVLEIAGAAWQLIGLPPDPGWRLKLLAFNHVLVRLAITEPQDLAPFLAEGQEPDAAVEEHLVALAKATLGLTD